MSLLPTIPGLTFYLQEGNEGHINLPEDDSEVVRLLVEYFYLLDYEPLVVPQKDDRANSAASRTDSSDTMSVRTEAGQYGHVYGTSAVSAFGGPAHPQSPFSTMFARRDRTDSSLTVHAMPGNDFSPFGRPSAGRRKSSRGPAPEPSPLATNEPNLTLHAMMYAAGDRYGVKGLKALALDKFKIQLTRHWYILLLCCDLLSVHADHFTGTRTSLVKRSTPSTTPPLLLTRICGKRLRMLLVGIAGCWISLQSRWRSWRSMGWHTSCSSGVGGLSRSMTSSHSLPSVKARTWLKSPFA